MFKPFVLVLIYVALIIMRACNIAEYFTRQTIGKKIKAARRTTTKVMIVLSLTFSRSLFSTCSKAFMKCHF